MLALLTDRRFAPLLATQAAGVFNDNLLKGALVALVTFRARREGVSGEALVQLSTALLMLPFFLFSALAGELSDRHDKAWLIRRLKWTELGVMALAAAGFITGHLPTLFVALFAMGAQSAFFGPVKYSILPQQLPEARLVAGNALVELSTFVAIVLGTLAGGWALESHSGENLVAAGLVAVAALGVVSARRVAPAPPAAGPQQPLRVWGATLRTLRAARQQPVVWQAIGGISAFWALGAVLFGVLPEIARDVVGGGPRSMAVLLSLFAVGVALGSVLVERLSRGRIEPGLLPLASLALALFCGDLAYTVEHHSGWHPRLLNDVLGLGAAGGVLSVPLYALLQKHSPGQVRSRMIAANNIHNAAAIVVAALSALGLRVLGLSLSGLLWVSAALTLVGTLWAGRVAFRWFARLVMSGLVRLVYRVRVRGLGAVPAEGAALVVCNHVSFHDSVLLGALSPRPARFVMDSEMYRLPVLHTLCRSLDVIPIAPSRRDPECLAAAYDAIDEALADGELVVIFPEGGITRDGEVAPFRPGVERILARRPVPVIPVALRGLWGSFFSRAHGPAMTRWPRRLFRRVELACGPARPGRTASADALRQAVMGLRGHWK